MTKKKMYGHWESLCGEILPEGMEGFIYLIYCKETKKFYIGKKNFYSTTRKAVAGKKRKQVIVKESDWMTYCSSSKYVKADIDKYGEDVFEFFIIQTYKTKAGLSYAEPNLLHKFDAMQKMLDGKTRLFYNANIPAVRFVPKEFYETAEKAITKLTKR